MTGSIERALYFLAEDDNGFVTTHAARDAGIPSQRLAQLAARGTLEHVSYGVYRLVRFPPSQFDSYMAATLWPTGVRGVLSHETALDLYEVCDVNPASVHFTVPSGHRIRRAIPKLYVVHHADLAERDLSGIEGMPATTLMRTIADCVDLGTGSYLLDQAVERGRAKGLLNKHQVATATVMLETRGKAQAHG